MQEQSNANSMTNSQNKNIKNNTKAIQNIFKFIDNYKFSKHLWFMIFVAFVFSVAVRMYYVYFIYSHPNYAYAFTWNDQLMINTNDGYAFAEGARDYLAGFHQPNDLSYIDFPPSKLTAWLTKILPFSFESIIFYMPVFLSSLIVIPILLIASEFRCLRAGFMGALLASVAHSYYNRTMAGYYDTDMLNIVFAVFVLWSLIRVSTKGDWISLVALPFFTTFYLWWYYSSFTLNAGFLGCFVLYTLVFQLKRAKNYQAIILMLIAMSTIGLTAKFIAILAILYLFLKIDKFTNLKNLSILLFVSFAIFVYFGGLNPIWFQLKFYLLRDLADYTTAKNITLHFYNVNQTIQESQDIEFDYFTQRISGHIATFILSCLGYILLCFRHKEFLLSVPMVALGFLSYKAGLRFSIYAVPIMGLCFAYLCYYLVKIADFPRILQRALLLGVTILALVPVYQHVKGYIMPSVFYTSEVEILDRLKNIAGREDYVISWWDYGYPIRYYSDVKTLVDGGKHLGNHNFPVSFALYKDQISSANMARLAVEYTEKAYKEKNKTEILKQMMKDYKFENPNDFIMSLRYLDLKLPEKTRDIYLFLPDRMTPLSNTISKFSFFDLTNGKETQTLDLVPFETAVLSEYGLKLTKNLEIRKDWLYLKLNGKELPINSIFETKMDPNNGRLNVKEFKGDSSGEFSLIIMRDYRRYVIVNNEALKSTFVQLFILERYNSDIFEPVILNPAAKVYKLKR